jgi:uncharacterized protein (TIGR03066 family)
MKRSLSLAAAFLFFVPAFAPAADPKLDELLGKWELTDAAAGIPKGSTFDFHKDGKLVIVATIDGQKKSFNFQYKLKDKLLEFTVGDKTDTTEISSLNKLELVCKDKDGTTAKFKRAK